MTKPNHIITVALVLLSFSHAFASAPDSVDLKPRIHGVLRARYEYAAQPSEQRFQVRNARLAISGDITQHIHYNIMADMCDRGKMKILDAWARLDLPAGLQFQMGQFRMPFGIETFRAPQNYIFANRAFMGKQMCNYRAVGAKISCRIPTAPLTVEAGMFNPNTIADHQEWHRPMAYSAKLTANIRNCTLSAGVMSISPDSVRSNLFDVAAQWSANRWLIATEYMHQHYTHRAATPAHSYVFNLQRWFPVKWWDFNRASIEARFDGITRHASGSPLPDRSLPVTTPATNRITLGTTLSCILPHKIGMDLRINYEQMIHHTSTPVTPHNSNKLLLELIAVF